MEVMEDTVCLLAGQKKHEDKYKDPEVLPKVNKAVMTGTMEFIEEHLRLHCGVIREPHAYVIRKAIIVQTYVDYPAYVTDVTPTEQVAQWAECTISQRAYSRVQDQQ